MYFKKLELQGFKSFAEPVSIEFNQGITCIVGPNGSGKSNVSDAIRWVLGEQSPKTLRGGKMEDVIFAGTANRKSRGMAEATLVIDNSDHRLDIDYNEVAITRRMFRSGESEYLINKVPCRLKDIRELIMDTGIGVDGYSIIGQGKIMDIVSNKPESRRELFEEAAGIVKYRSKKEESEKKLENSQNNMDKVNAVIHEIEGRIDGLKEDSIKAREYLELKERYKTIEINLVLKQVESIELKNEYVKDEIMEAANDIESFRGEKEAIDREVGDARARSEELERISGETQNKLVEAMENINALSGQSTLDQQKLEQIERDKDRINYEKEGLDGRKEKEETNRENLMKSREDLLSELDVYQQDLALKQQSLSELSAKEQTSAEALNTANRRSAEILTLANRRAEELRIEIGKVRARAKVIDEMQQAYEGYNYGVRFLMKQNLPGIHGVAGELIDVPLGFETAIETALGATVQNIICDTERTAQEAIRLLKENKAGRLTFLPLTGIKPNTPAFEDRIRKTSGFKGFATELVRFNAKYQKAVDFLLGRVIVVDTLNNAVQMSKSVTTGFRFVTLEGDVVTAQGAMTGGSSKNTTAGLIERKAEAEALEAKAVRLEKELDEVQSKAEKEIKAAQDEASLKNRGAAELRQDIEDARTALGDARLKVQEYTMQLRGMDDLIARVDETIKDIEAQKLAKGDEFEALEAEKNRILGGSDGLLVKLEEAQQERTRLQELLEDSQDERVKILHQLEESEQRKNEIDESFLDAQRRKNDAEIRQAKNETLLEGYKDRLWQDFEVSYIQAMEFQKKDFSMNAAQKESREIKNRMKELGDVNVGAIKEYETVSERYDFLTAQREDLQAAVDALKQIIGEMDKNIRKSFTESFNSINTNFALTFTELFGGGTAELKLEDENNPLECGIEIEAQPPGKKLQNMNLLSGGEKTMTAIALMFAILKTKPTPFCILDEVEAALDEVNIENFSNYLKKGFGDIQFALITHQKRTMEHADVLYGVTMPERGISKVISLKLGDEFAALDE